MSKTISASVRQCFAKFKSLEGEHQNYPGLEDEHGRFRVWAGNISAHRAGGRRSLEYRLRDSSNLYSMVLALLDDLLDGLANLAAVSREVNVEKKDVDSQSESLHDPYENEDDDEDDAQLFGLVDDEKQADDPISRAVEEIREVNICLLRFSMTLRNPARHDQMKESSSTSTQYFEAYDIAHVRTKFPEAPPFLHERLGKAISKHRQYFKYREGHHSKLAEGLDDEKAVGNERPSTIATSIKAPDDPGLEMPVKDDEIEMESVGTATSFAPTTAGDATLRPPPLPETGRDGSPFECPLCFGIVVAEDERSWRYDIACD